MNNQTKRGIHENYLIKTSKKMSSTREVVENKYLNNELVGRYSWYVIIGVIIFILPQMADFSLKEIGVFLVTILYLMGSVSILVSVIPGYTYAKVSAQRLAEFDAVKALLASE